MPPPAMPTSKGSGGGVSSLNPLPSILTGATKVKEPYLSKLFEKFKALAGGDGAARPWSRLVKADKTDDLMKSGSYRVTWRANAPRYLLFVTRDGVFAFHVGSEMGSEGSCYHIPGLYFPRRKAHTEHIDKTVIDVELVTDTEGGVIVPRFLLGDILVYEGHPLWKQEASLDRRLQCMDVELIRPRKEDKTRDYSKEPVKIRMKQFFSAEKIEGVFDKTLRQLTHSHDGILLIPGKTAYRGTQSAFHWSTRAAPAAGEEEAHNRKSLVALFTGR